MTKYTPKDILTKYATTVIRKNRVFEKEGVAQVNSSKPDNYTPKKYSKDIVLWHAPKNWIRLEFEDEPDKNRRHIAECESALKGYEIQYCISEHEGAKSPYLNICNIKGLPLNADNKLYKEALIDLILPSGAKEQLDKTNYQWTLSPVIGHPHWKPKYKGAIHQIIRGVHPLDQVNTYPKELITKIERLKKYAKSSTMELLQNNQWLNDFLLNYCTSHLLPKGSRHRVVEKNLAIFIFHRSDRDEILYKYLAAQGRTTDTLKTWTNAIIRGEYKDVSPGELKRWITENNVDYVIPKYAEAASTSEEAPVTEDAIALLKDSKLVYNIVELVHKCGVVGEENTILVLIIKLALRLVKGHKPTSSNVIVSDISGAGKDAITGATTKVMVPADKLMHRTRFSDKALEYMMVGKDENYTLDGMVFYLEDPEEDMIKSQAFRVIASGQNEATVVKDQELLELSVKGKPVIIVTSMNASIDLEGERRWDAVPTDTSEALTKHVIREKFRISEEGVNKTEKPLLAQAVQILKPCEVLIPYSKKICTYFEKNPSLIMRTRTDNFLDYIKASAALHQHQRKRDEKGRVLADDFDYEYARYVFSVLGDAEGGMLNSIERKLVEILKTKAEPITINELAGTKGFPRSVAWLYEHQDNLKSRHIIGEISEWNEKANKPVTKIFYDMGASALGIPEGLVLFGFPAELENQNKEGFLGFLGFIDIVKELNENRTKMGLSPMLFVDIAQNSNLSQFGWKTNTTKKTFLLEVFQSGKKTTGKPTLLDRINELREYIEKVESTGHDVTYSALTNAFDVDFIEKCKEQQILSVDPKGFYHMQQGGLNG
jgi:hypothetical protein